MEKNIIKEIYLIRHGQTEWNSQHRTQGCEHDIPLDETGHKQAIATGKYLQKYRTMDKPFDLIISSGMSRADQTAKNIAKQLSYNKPILIIDNFKEKCHGEIGGKTNQELKSDKKFIEYTKANEKYDNEPDPINQRFIYYQNNILFNKLYQTELFSELKNRIKKALKQVLNRPESKIIIISHGGTIQEILKLLTNIDDYIPIDNKYGSNCHIAYIKTTQKIINNKKKIKYQIMKLSNTQHLKLEL
jgi:broad specificity phosphatase PhoE